MVHQIEIWERESESESERERERERERETHGQRAGPALSRIWHLTHLQTHSDKWTTLQRSSWDNTHMHSVQWDPAAVRQSRHGALMAPLVRQLPEPAVPLLFGSNFWPSSADNNREIVHMNEFSISYFFPRCLIFCPVREIWTCVFIQIIIGSPIYLFIYSNIFVFLLEIDNKRGEWITFEININIHGK